MVKYLILSLSFLFCFFKSSAQDTIKVNTHNKVVIKTNPSVGHTYYSSWGTFPAKDVSYRKVYMYLEFGCAPGLRCGEWDYLNHIYIGKKGGVNGDSLHYELARFITPYGFYWNSSQNWKHGWIFDVTEFSDILHDSVQILYKHTGYESNTDRGWTVTLDFNFVKGEPALIPMGYNSLHSLNAPYGNPNRTFESVVTDKSFQVPAGADYTDIMTLQTGHGMDQQQNCAEFCSKRRTLKLNGQVISEKNIWRDDCGFNSVFPQAGTWVYDRAGWCPGAPVYADHVYLPTAAGSNNTLAFNMEAYTNTVGGSANYSISSYAFFYKNNQKQVDASVDRILSPSTEFESSRLNPICGAPIIRVKNMGKETITSLDFEYGKLGGSLQKIWVPCNIKPFESQVVTLEAVYNWVGASNQFVVNITKVNSKEDEYRQDNIAYSTIVNAPVTPNAIVVLLKTNNAPSENSYTIKDAWGKVIRNKSGFAPNTIYRDTVYLDNNVCYSFEFSDEGQGPSNNPLNEDGLEWWANSGDGAGYVQLRRLSNNAMLKNFLSDFGTKHIYNFTSSYSMSTEAPELGQSLELHVFPNPARNEVNLHIESANNGLFQVSIVDVTGKEVYMRKGQSNSEDIQVSNLAKGVYTAIVNKDGVVLTKKFVVLD